VEEVPLSFLTCFFTDEDITFFLREECFFFLDDSEERLSSLLLSDSAPTLYDLSSSSNS